MLFLSFEIAYCPYLHRVIDFQGTETVLHRSFPWNQGQIRWQNAKHGNTMNESLLA